jgi:hypothetical protein
MVGRAHALALIFVASIMVLANGRAMATPDTVQVDTCGSLYVDGNRLLSPYTWIVEKEDSVLYLDCRIIGGEGTTGVRVVMSDLRKPPPVVVHIPPDVARRWTVDSLAGVVFRNAARAGESDSIALEAAIRAYREATGVVDSVHRVPGHIQVYWTEDGLEGPEEVLFASDGPPPPPIEELLRSTAKSFAMCLALCRLETVKRGNGGYTSTCYSPQWSVEVLHALEILDGNVAGDRALAETTITHQMGQAFLESLRSPKPLDR